MYDIGTILHGKNTRIGNLWIITQDKSFIASLLYDGNAQVIAPDATYKTDLMSPGMMIASDHDIAASLGGWDKMPQWASAFVRQRILVPGLAPISTTIPASALAAIYKAIGPIATNREHLLDKGLIKSKIDICDHEYKPYFGFTDVYEYCVHCDHKKGMPQ